MDIQSYLLGKKAGGGSSGGRDWTKLGYDKEPSFIKDGYDYALTIMNNWDSSLDDYSGYFCQDNNLVYMPLVDMKNANYTAEMFANCEKLEYVPSLDTKNVVDMSFMFAECRVLKEVPQLNTENATNIESLFVLCERLEEIPQLNTSNVTTMNQTFHGCSKLKTIPLLDFGNVADISIMCDLCPELINLGGFKDLGKAYSTSADANKSEYTLKLSSSKKLTHDSLMNVINNLYDIAAKGCNTQKLVLGSTNLNKLSASEKAIATNKGWTLS